MRCPVHRRFFLIRRSSIDGSPVNSTHGGCFCLSLWRSRPKDALALAILLCISSSMHPLHGIVIVSSVLPNFSRNSISPRCFAIFQAVDYSSHLSHGWNLFEACLGNALRDVVQSFVIYVARDVVYFWKCSLQLATTLLLSEKVCIPSVDFW